MRARAFTILEILVVLSVIAILVGVAVPRFKGMQDETNIYKVKGDLKTLHTAIESYHMSQGEYPDTTDTICASYLIAATPSMVSTPLYDPFGATTTSEYKYIRSPNGKYFVIWSAGLPGQIPPTDVTDTGDITY